MDGPWDRIHGHRTQREQLVRSVKRNRLAHAYLFLGPRGIGKSLFARAFAQGLLCEGTPSNDIAACGKCVACRQFNEGSHPGFFLLAPPEGKREILVSRIKGSDKDKSTPGLLKSLSLSSRDGGRKVVLVADADQLNQEAANAFLKTLEEPPANCVLLLLAPDAASVLSTIRSRCQQLQFSPLTEQEVCDILLAQQLVEDSQEAEQLAAIAEGSLEVAQELIAGNLGEIRSLLISGLSKPRRLNSIKLAARIIEEIEERSRDSAAVRHNALWTLRLATGWYRSVLQQVSDPESMRADEVGDFCRELPVSDRDRLELLLDLLECTWQAERNLDNLMPVPLCIESWMESVRQACRAIPTD